MSSTSEIQKFFTNQTIFLTGATGFLGKAILEKLLRTCYDLKRVYVLIRPKKGKTAEERIKDLFDYPLYDLLKTERPDYKLKISLISGDCEQKNLGLDKFERELLIREVTCVIHGAASVKFDQHIRSAAKINIKAVREMLNLAKEMTQLKVYLHISTLYSNCHLEDIGEQFYEPPIEADQLFGVLDGLDDETLTEITPKLLGKSPNTYAFTKSIAEDLIRREGQGLPIAVVRPAVITATHREPLVGWIDNFYGPTGIVLGASLGVIKSFNADPDNAAELVPLDYVVNVTLAVALEVNNKSDQIVVEKKIPIYNFFTSKTNMITWRKFMAYIEKHAWNYPTPKVVWYYSFRLNKNSNWHNFYIFFVHTLVAYFVDFVLLCIGKPRIAVKGYQRINKLISLTTYFALKTFTFSDNNVQKLKKILNEDDKKLFNFNMDDIDWDKYCHDSILGGRTFLLKESLDTIVEGKRKLFYLGIAHYTFLIVFWFAVFKIFMFFVNLVL